MKRLAVLDNRKEWMDGNIVLGPLSSLLWRYQYMYGTQMRIHIYTDGHYPRDLTAGNRSP